MSDTSFGIIVGETFNVLWKRLSEGGFIKQPDSTAEFIYLFILFLLLTIYIAKILCIICT